MNIQVTSQDIQRGKRGCLYNNPASLALNRATGKEWAVLYDTARPLIPSGRYSHRYGASHELPIEVAAWLRAFDEGGAVAPIAFEFTLQAAKAAA